MRHVIAVVLLTALPMMYGCGGPITEDVQPTFEDVSEPEETKNLCGDLICDKDIGEDYWNCLDCVNPFTGGPTNGYCGDGICYNETMVSCLRDCRPQAYKKDNLPWNLNKPRIEIPWFGPEGPLPGPQPGPQPDPQPKLY
jgi:hypothetical protein